MQTAKISVDVSLMPLVLQRMQRGFGDSDIEHMIAEYERLFASGRRYAIVVYSDAGAPIINVSQRRRIASWWKARADAVRHANICTAVVLESPLLRGSMTALNWLVEPITPQKAFATFQEAVDYCAAMLRRAGLDGPADLAALKRVRRA